MCGYVLTPFCKGDAPQIKDWESCCVVTEGADYRKVVGKGDFKIVRII